MNDFVSSVLAENWRDLFLTLHHLTQDDPRAYDAEVAVFGTALAEINESVGRAFSRFLADQTDELKDQVEQCVRTTIEKYQAYPFSPVAAFFRRFYSYLPTSTPELEQLEELAARAGPKESENAGESLIEIENIVVAAYGEDSLQKIRIGIDVNGTCPEN